MANMIDYLAWRGDLTFDERPFNEVDNLILAELSYLKLPRIGPKPGDGRILLLRDLYAQYEKEENVVYSQINDPRLALKAAAETERFGWIGVSDCADELDTEKQVQFAAMTFHLGDGSVYVAFRGTDSSLTGWREDFNTTYLSETPGQGMAVQYLEAAAERCRGLLRVGGHSKGGNLAVYASAFAPESVRYRIREVYSNDGPGFNSKITDTVEYQTILDKVVLFMPEESMVGILLSNKDEKNIIRSDASGIRQHNPYTWQVRGTAFERGEKQKAASTFLDNATDQLAGNLTDSQKERIISSVFDSLEASGVSTVQDMKEKPQALLNMLKTVLTADDSLKDTGLGLLRLLQAGGSAALDGTKRAVQEKLSELRTQIKEEQAAREPEKDEHDGNA